MSVKTRMLKSIGKLARRQDRGKDTTAYCLDDLSREHLELVEEFIDSFPTHEQASGSSIEEELFRPLLCSPDEEELFRPLLCSPDEERARVKAYLDPIMGQCWSDPDPIGFLIDSHRQLRDAAEMHAVDTRLTSGRAHDFLTESAEPGATFADPVGSLISLVRSLRQDAQLKAVKDKANTGPCPEEYGGMSPFEAAAEANRLLVRQASGVHHASLHQFITRIYHLARIMGPSMTIQRLPEWNPDKAQAAAQRDLG